MHLVGAGVNKNRKEKGHPQSELTFNTVIPGLDPTEQGVKLGRRHFSKGSLIFVPFEYRLTLCGR